MRRISIVLFGLLILSTFGAAGKVEAPLEPQTPEQHILDGIIPVAVPPDNQNWPRAAYSSVKDQYLVVFYSNTNDGDIMGRYVDESTGEPLGDIIDIASSSAKEYSPDVVYDPNSERFLVVWEKYLCRMVVDEEKCNYAIFGRLLHPAYSDSSPFAGSEIIVAHEHNVIDLRKPRAAFNQDDNQFLVVFQRGFNAVNGQMMGSHVSSPPILYPTYGFSIRIYVDGSDAEYPDVAWGGEADTFLVVWGNVKTPYTDGTIQAKHLHDTYQAGGSQFEGSEFKVAPFLDGDDPLSDHCSSPVVSYDPQNRHYVVLFSHYDSVSPYSTKTIHAQRVKNTYFPASRKDWAFTVETRKDIQNVGHYFMDIDYSGSDEVMQVAYISIDFQPSPMNYGLYWVNGRTINDARVSPAKIIRAGGEDIYIGAPGISGSNNGRALVVWSEDKGAEESDRDILGKRVAPYRVNLPCVFNDN